MRNKESTKLKILIATPLYAPDSGGPAMEAALLVHELPKEGIDVQVCSFGRVRHLPRLVRHMKYALDLLNKSKNVDFIVAIDTFSVCIPAALVSIITGKKFVVRVPGDFAWEQSVQRFGVEDDIVSFQNKHYGWKIEALKLMEKLAVRRADLVVTCSEFLKKIVSGWGVNENKLMSIYLGIDLEEKFVLPQRPEGRIIFSLGRFVPWKGFGMLVDIMLELPSEWKLVIVGDGPLKKSLQEEVTTRSLNDRVFMPGILPREHVLGWYRACDVFVLNTYQENFSFQTLEAMAAGANIITTTTGALPELITNGVEGVLCEPGDKEAFKSAILSTETDLSMWKARREKARNKSNNFSEKESAEKFAQALRNLI